MYDSLNYQVNRFALYCIALAFITGAIALFLPLDIPDGYNASHMDRVVWLNDNRVYFILGWSNQIAAMLSLTGIFLGIAWQVRIKNQLRALLAAAVAVVSVVAFIIPKFIAVWSIPQLAEVAVDGAVGSEVSGTLLPILNVSVPYSLFTSFDFLGFWLYAVFALLVAGPLYDHSMSSKVSAVSLGAYGAIYHGMLVVMLLGGIEIADLSDYFINISGLLLFMAIAMIFSFRSSMRAAAQ
ncbi:MAG: hypothetical protein AAF542_00860 [Pseudomonadota bacterium]